MTGEYTERACLFGPNDSLVGVMCSPVRSNVSHDLAIVFLNTGVIHRVGHHRMYVLLARELARQGYSSLRFDFAGIGDSRAAEGRASVLESNLCDIRVALDMVESSTDRRRVILVGLCSGADYSVLYSHSDSRVVGLVLLDPYIPPTNRHFLNFVLLRLMSPRGLLQFRPNRSFLVRMIVGALSRSRGETMGLQHISFEGADARATLERIYKKLVDARVQMLVVCTGSNVTPRHSYKSQFIDAFKSVSFRDRLQLHYFDECDHLFSSPESRDALNAAALDWLTSSQFDPRGVVDVRVDVVASP